jgi:hypothetical protein
LFIDTRGLSGSGDNNGAEIGLFAGVDGESGKDSRTEGGDTEWMIHEGTPCFRRASPQAGGSKNQAPGEENRRSLFQLNFD